VSGYGSVAMEAESRKHVKYSSVVAMCYLVPVEFETLGALGEEAMAFISDLGCRIATATSDVRSSLFLLCNAL